MTSLEYWKEYHKKHPRGRKLARQNRRRITSDNYVSGPRGNSSPFTGVALEPSKDERYTRGQTWGALHKAWIGFKIANRKGNYLERLNYAVKIQNLQSDLEIQRASFPHLGLLGDRIFLFDKEKEEEVRATESQTKQEIEELKAKKKLKKAHIQQIVHIGDLTDMERECLPDFYSSDSVERISLVD